MDYEIIQDILSMASNVFDIISGISLYIISHIHIKDRIEKKKAQKQQIHDNEN